MSKGVGGGERVRGGGWVGGGRGGSHLAFLIFNSQSTSNVISRQNTSQSRCLLGIPARLMFKPTGK